MTKEQFLAIIKNYKEFLDTLDIYSDFGIDLIDSKHSISTPVDRMFQIFCESNYTESGVDLINWFLFEKDFGTKDLDCETPQDLYSLIKEYELNEN